MSYLITEVHTLTIAAQKPKPTQSLQLHRSRKFINNVTPTFQSFSPTFKRPSIFGYKSQDSSRIGYCFIPDIPRLLSSELLHSSFINDATFRRLGRHFSVGWYVTPSHRLQRIFLRENNDIFPDPKGILTLGRGFTCKETSTDPPFSISDTHIW